MIDPLEKKKENLERIEKNLNKVHKIIIYNYKSSKYIAGKICQKIGLRFAPELRYYYSRMEQ